MRVDVTQLDPVRFDISHRHVPNIGPVHLITPAKAMFSFQPNELHLRSLVVRESDGVVISAGFPKFFNYSEDKASDAIVMRGLAERRVIWKGKVDGTLVIRSVVRGAVGVPHGDRGHVYLRTRGSHELGAFDEPVRKLFWKHHHEWLDPSYLLEGSHLFEYCAPDNRIVLHYEQARLWALARVMYDGDELTVHDPFPPQSMDEPKHWVFGWEPADIAAEIAVQTHEEGYVAWTIVADTTTHGRTYHLSKWKTDWYKKMHAMRSESSPRFIREYCVRHNLHSLQSFKNQLAQDGFDWEFASFLEPSFKEFCMHWMSVRTLVALFEATCDSMMLGRLASSGDRKTLALTLKKYAADMKVDWLFNYGIAKYTGKLDTAEEIMLSHVLDIGVNELRNLKKSWA